MLDNKKFIQSSIKEILGEAVEISKISCNGIETYPLQEYILQSTFLKMTGYSEQKLKCICWDIASIDCDFRYKIFQHWDFGECSRLEDKNKIFKSLVDSIKIYNTTFNAESYIHDLKGSQNKIVTGSFDFCKTVLLDSSLKYFYERDCNFFIHDSETFKQETKICQGNNIFSGNLKLLYEKLYRHRNRTAHNLTSYQKNLPKINTLLKKDDRENYFYYFVLLIILDEVFIALYSELINILTRNNW